jgi:alkylation response protein AidB-like acyl-CoA dehydrogenase
MDLNPSPEQQQLVDTFSALYAKESSTDRVRAAEPSGHDPDLWQRVAAVGALEMAVAEESGGWGASMIDLALVAEQHGRYVGSCPLLEAQVAARLVARVGGERADALLQRILSGDALVTLALHQPRNGVLGMVPSGAVADLVVFLDGDRLVCVDPGPDRRAVANLGSLPVADIPVADLRAGTGGRQELAAGVGAAAAIEVARDEWMVLMANALAGMGARSIEIGVDYVKERQAFGVPIGSFQAVAHGLADAATAVDGGVLLAREAAWAAGSDVDRASELAALSFGFNAESARQASYRSLHYHGGYGFMLEYDIQLYFRRAKAWPAQFGEPRLAYARAAGLRLARTAPEP